MSSNYQHNPFHIQKFFAQNIITSKLEPGGKFQVVYNAAYIFCYLVCFIYCIVTNDNRVGELRYNFISQMRFCMQFYFGTILLCQISFTMTLFRKEYVHSYHALINHTRELRKIDIHTTFSRAQTIFMYIVVFSSVIGMAIYDFQTFGHRYNAAFFICHYLPSTAIAIYLISACTLMRICASKYFSMNAFLKTLTLPEKSCINKYYQNKRNENPDELMKIVPDEDYTVYQKIFILHDEITETARTLNKISGYDFLIYMVITTIDILSFIYDLFMDLVVYMKGNRIPARTIYAPEYWSVMSLLGMAALISASSELMDCANETKSYLHQLRNLYPKLNEHVRDFLVEENIVNTEKWLQQIKRDSILLKSYPH